MKKKTKLLFASVALAGCALSVAPSMLEDSSEPTSAIFHSSVNNLATEWYHELTNVEQARTKGLTGNGVTIAVIDSGIAHDVQGLSEKVVARYDYSADLEYKDGKPVLDVDHGTQVASVIASDSFGVAPGARIFEFNIAQGGRYGSAPGGAVKAYEKILELLDNGETIDIVQMSFGSRNYSEKEEKLLKKIASKGVLLVASTGNHGTDEIRYPAAYPNVIAVGNIDSTKSRFETSGYGSYVDVVAPGVELNSLMKDGTISPFTGTSASTPFVSGVLALYKEAYPTATPTKLAEMLFENAADLGIEGKDEEYGYGLVNAAPPEQYNVEDTLIEKVLFSLGLQNRY